jgi:tetratricopeptide (TPR) repeat protein
MYIDSWIKLGDAKYLSHFFKDAEDNYKKAYDLLIENDRYKSDIIRMAELCSKMSKTYYQLGDLINMRVYQEAKVSMLNLYVEDNQSFEIKKYHNQSLYELANVFYQEGKYEKATNLLLGSIEKTEKLFAESNMKNVREKIFYETAVAYLKLAKIYSYKGRYTDAMKLFENLSLNYNIYYKNELSTIKDILVDIEVEKGRVLFNQNQYEKALDYIKKFLEIENDLLEKDTPQSKQTLIEYYLLMCQCLLMLKNYKETTKYILKALPLIDEKKKEQTIKSNRFVIFSNLILSELFDHNGDYEKTEKLLLDTVDISLNMCKKIYGIETFIDYVQSNWSLAQFYLKRNRTIEYNDTLETIYKSTKIYVGRTTDVGVLEIMDQVSIYLATINKNDIEKSKDYLSTSLIAKERSLHFNYLEDKELILSDIYLLKATIDKNNIEVELIDKAKEIIDRIYEKSKDDFVLERKNRLDSIINILKEMGIYE